MEEVPRNLSCDQRFGRGRHSGLVVLLASRSPPDAIPQLPDLVGDGPYTAGHQVVGAPDNRRPMPSRWLRHRSAIGALHVQTENDVNDALDIPEAACTEPEGNLHQSVLGPVDLEGEADGSEFDKPEPEVAGVAVAIVGLEIADAAVFIFELPLKQDVGSHGRVGIVVASRVFVAERDLEILVVEVTDSDIAGVQLHRETLG